MATVVNLTPGIYEFVGSLDHPYRRWDGENWFDNAQTVRGAATRKTQSLRRDEYESRVKSANSIRLVANVDGSSLVVEFAPTQLELF